MARRGSPLGIHCRHNVRTAWALDRCEFAGDGDLGGLEACKGVLDLERVFRRTAEGAELFAFGEDFLAGHGVDDEGDDDTDPGCGSEG